METMNALSMSKSQCRETYLNNNNQPYDKIVIGAIIFDKSTSEPRKVLLLKRAAHERYYPNIFEIPGGNVEDTDATIRDAFIREVHEETGLQVSEITAAVKPFTYSMEKKVVDEETEEVSSVLRTSLQLNFVCEVLMSIWREGSWRGVKLQSSTLRNRCGLSWRRHLRRWHRTFTEMIARFLKP